MKRGTYVPDCVSTFPSVTPVAAAAIATGVGPADHHIPSMNWYHRGEQRYVEYGSSFEASRQFGLLRSLQDTVYNMNLAHLSREREDGLRAPAGRRPCARSGTTYLMYRGRTRHEASDEGMYPRLARVRELPPRRLGPGRALLRGPVRLAQDGLPRDARHARPARPAHGLRGRLLRRERPLRLHAVLAARQRHLLAQARAVRPGHLDRVGRPRARAADARGRRPRRVPGGPRGHRHERPLADRRRRPGQPGRRAGRLRRADPVRRPLEGKEIAVCPSQRSAQVYVLDDERREQLTRRSPATCTRSRASTWSSTATATTRPWSGRPRGELRFAPGGDLIDARGGSWSVDGDLDTLGLDVATAAWARAPTPTRSGGSGRRSSPRRRATCCCRPAAATSSSTGAASPTSAAAATGRSTAAIRSARW